jgi:hypothetical protein
MFLWPAPSVRKEDPRSGTSFLYLKTRLIYLLQCSGATPCTTCASEGRQCLYDPTRDRRRKAYTAELLNFRVALCRMAAKLRSGTLEEISWLIWEIQKLPTDQDAVNYLVRKC